MKNKKITHDCGCGCNRRDFISTSATAAFGLSTLPVVNLFGTTTVIPEMRFKKGAKVKTVFVYSSTEELAKNPDAWWSWPGTEFDAEGHHQKYAAEIKKMNSRLEMNISIGHNAVADNEDVQKVIQEIKSEQPDGLLLILFHNPNRPQAETLLEAAEKMNIPVIFYIELGVTHGSVRKYQRPGIHFIQAKEDFEAIEMGLRMINTRKVLKQSVLLSITDEEGRSDFQEPFLGITIKPVLFGRYTEIFHSMSINNQAKDFISKISRSAIENNKVTTEALENATRAYFALKEIIEEENADAVTMNCLRRGMLKPCLGFSMLNNQLIPAVCENDMNAAFGQILAQAITGQPGFQHNPAYNTEEDRYYASHCTCATKLHGPDKEEMDYRLTRFLHTNEGSCAIQVFWKPEEPVTMIHYYSGEKPQLDIYSGTVYKSHRELVGCTTNVEITITDRENANSVQGHHNILLSGNWTKTFMDFARLHKLQIMEKLV